MKQGRDSLPPVSIALALTVVMSLAACGQRYIAGTDIPIAHGHEASFDCDPQRWRKKRTGEQLATTAGTLTCVGFAEGRDYEYQTFYVSKAREKGWEMILMIGNAIRFRKDGQCLDAGFLDAGALDMGADDLGTEGYIVFIVSDIETPEDCAHPMMPREEDK